MRLRGGRGWGIVRMVVALALLAACGSGAQQAPASGTTVASGLPKVLAVESFLADIAQNVAGDRLQVATLMPLGLDPHGFEPTPQDVARVGAADVLIVNGAGFEGWLAELLDNAGGKRQVIEASAGLTSRDVSHDVGHDGEVAQAGDEGDPHFWLDPTKVVRYVENIRDGLSEADPGGKEAYAANAAAYIARLNELDGWIRQQIDQIPAKRRLLVTNHESLGYYADRYGLRIVGAVVPSVTTDAAPSAQQLAGLVDLIRSSRRAGSLPGDRGQSTAGPAAARRDGYCRCHGHLYAFDYGAGWQRADVPGHDALQYRADRGSAEVGRKDEGRRCWSPHGWILRMCRSPTTGRLSCSDLTFQVPHGAQVAVVGPNGAGKSTLFKALVGLLPVQEGRILVHGRTLGSHQDCVAYVPQRDEVDWRFPVTVEDVVMMGRFARQGYFGRASKADRKAVAAALDHMAIGDLARRPIGDLSGGQQQRRVSGACPGAGAAYPVDGRAVYGGRCDDAGGGAATAGRSAWGRADRACLHPRLEPGDAAF